MTTEVFSLSCVISYSIFFIIITLNCIILKDFTSRVNRNEFNCIYESFTVGGEVAININIFSFSINLQIEF